MDWASGASPLVTTAHTTYTTDMRGRDIDLVKGLDPAIVTVTNPLTNSIRWNSANRKWELYNGSTWAALIDYYAIEVGAFTGDVTKAAGASVLTIGAFTGDVTKSGMALTIGANAVGDSKLRDSASLSVIGRAANSVGDPADIAAGADDRLLTRTAGALAWTQVTVGMFPDNVVSNAKLAQVATQTFKGRNTAATGNPEDLSVATAKGMLGLSGSNTGDEPSASESTEGVLEIATQAETNAGTDDARALTALKLKNVVRPAFSAYRAAAQTLTNGAFTSIFADTEDFDTNSNYAPGTGRFTPTVAGKYLVWGHGGPGGNSAGSAVQLAIYKNGAASKISYDRAPGGTGIGHSVTAFVDMNGTTDYLEFLILQDSGGDQALTTGIYNSFAGHWVCA